MSGKGKSAETKGGKLAALRKSNQKAGKLAPKGKSQAVAEKAPVVKVEKVPVDPSNPFASLSKFGDELAILAETIQPKSYGPEGRKTQYYSMPAKHQPVFDIVGLNKFPLELTNFGYEDAALKYQIKITVDNVVKMLQCDETYLTELKRCLPLLKLDVDPTLRNPYLTPEFNEFKMIIRNYWSEDTRNKTKPVLKDIKNNPIKPEDIKANDRVRMRVACDSVSTYTTDEGETIAKFGMTVRAIHKLPPVISPDMEASSPVEEHLANASMLKRKKVSKDGDTPKKKGKKGDKDAEEAEVDEDTQIQEENGEADELADEQEEGEAEDGNE